MGEYGSSGVRWINELDGEKNINRRDRHLHDYAIRTSIQRRKKEPAFFGTSLSSNSSLRVSLIERRLHLVRVALALLETFVSRSGATR